MENKLSFFEAWRAKNREKKYREVLSEEKSSAEVKENKNLSTFSKYGERKMSAPVVASEISVEKAKEVSFLFESIKQNNMENERKICRNEDTGSSSIILSSKEKTASTVGVSEELKKTINTANHKDMTADKTKCSYMKRNIGKSKEQLNENLKIETIVEKQDKTEVKNEKGLLAKTPFSYRKPLAETTLDTVSSTAKQKDSYSSLSYGSNRPGSLNFSPISVFSKTPKLEISVRGEKATLKESQIEKPTAAAKTEKDLESGVKTCLKVSPKSDSVSLSKVQSEICSESKQASKIVLFKKAKELGKVAEAEKKKTTTNLETTCGKEISGRCLKKDLTSEETKIKMDGTTTSAEKGGTLRTTTTVDKSEFLGMKTSSQTSTKVSGSEKSEINQETEVSDKKTSLNASQKIPTKREPVKQIRNSINSTFLNCSPNEAKVKESTNKTEKGKLNSNDPQVEQKKQEFNVSGVQPSTECKLNPAKLTLINKEFKKEALNIQESFSALIKQGELLVENRSKDCGKFQTGCQNDRKETSYTSQDDSKSESISLRKDEKKVLKKSKGKTRVQECYPKTQKLLAGKPINAFEQANFEESKRESLVSPTKVEAFLRESLNVPSVLVENKPVKSLEAVVEEIVTSTSEKSRFEKPNASKMKYATKGGEVVLGVVSIKPSTKVDACESSDSLSAVSVIPKDQPEALVSAASASDREYLTVSLGDTKEDVLELVERDSTCPKEFSPFSDLSDDSYDHYLPSISVCTWRRSRRSSSTPRRIFPQEAAASGCRSFRTKESSPVVFDAGLTFDLSSNRSFLRHHFKPQPAFADQKTTSNALSLRIADFLKRTDHVMEEWKHLGRKTTDDLQSLVQVPSQKVRGHSGKSATNIMIKGLLNYSKASRSSSMRSRSTLKTSEYSDRTISDIDELSEMTLDLSEERAASTAQAERLEAETAERVRLEQELAQVQSEKKNLQQASERLEMELFYARADVNGLSESEADLEDGGGDAALYKNKCERAMRELEFTRRRLQQQHEDDLEQLVGLKKQLEKKLADAYEEVEEQRQVAGQWKRKVQKLQSELNDLRLLLEEQSSRNNLLEKKQRKFDSEIQLLQEELRSEKNQKERASREKEMAFAEKYSLEQNLSSVRLELELKEEKVASLTRELEEFTCGGGTEQEVTQLRKSKHDLEIKVKEQEEELDELAGQVSMLEGNKLRLEMTLESLRKEHRREMCQRDDELDEVRANAQKKIKVLESQLESEHEERTLLVREKHEIERRLADAEERGRHCRAVDEDALQRARRDLKKTKALLRDAQIMLERAKQDSPSKAALRALKNQLEDAELARASALKAKQSLESDFNEVSGQLEEALKGKADAEARCQAALREMNTLRNQVDENEEEVAELLKKYRQAVQQLSAEQLANQETSGALAEAEAERASLRDQLAELTAKLEANTVVDPVSGMAQKKLEIRVKELENRLELEQTTRGRLEVQITRLKENLERLNEECVQARTKEQAATDLTRKLQRSLREAKEELAVQLAKEQESILKRKELEKRLETAEQEAATAKTDLRLAIKRIEDLQSAISGEIGTDSERSESEEEDSGEDSIISHSPALKTTRTPNLNPR